MKAHRGTLLTAVAMCMGMSFANAQNQTTPTVNELLQIHTLGAFALSPDGNTIAFQIQQPDYQADNYKVELVLEETRSQKRLSMPPLEGTPGAFEWSPDGRSLAVLIYPKSGNGQIWAIPSDGGSAWQVSDSQTAIGSFHWSPDSAHLAILTTQPDRAMEGRSAQFGSYEVVGKDYQQAGLWLVDASKEGGPHPPKVLTRSSEYSIVDFSWSPDGAQIAFTAAATPLLNSYSSQDIYLLDRRKGDAVRKVVALPSPDFSPMFSPDGRELAFMSWLGKPDFFYSNVHIATVEIARVWDHAATVPADVHDVTSAFNETAFLRAWSGDTLYFDAEQKTEHHLFAIRSDGAQLRQVTSGKSFALTGVSFSHDARRVALAAEDSVHVPELYISDLPTLKLQQLTKLTDQVENMNLAKPSLIHWRSTDGTTIEGVLYSPQLTQPGKSHPLVVDLHGGPADVSQVTLDPSEPVYPTQCLVAHGAFVLKPNYRNSSGYGAAFMADYLRNVGASEAADVLTGIDALVAKGQVDPDRIAVVGSSWGGYLTAWLITHSLRFKAASESSGIIDLPLNYFLTDNPALYQQFFHGSTQTANELYQRNSPLTAVANVRTPLLLQAGTDDRRVPKANSEELYRALQQNGVSSRLIIYSGFGHGHNSPKEMRAATQGNLDWLSFYLWGEPFPANSSLWGSSEER